MASIIKRADRPKPYLVYYFDTSGHRRGKSFLLRKDAREFAARMDANKRRATGPDVLLSQAITGYINDTLANAGSTLTAERYHTTMKQFLEAVGEKVIRKVTAGDIEGYKRTRLSHVGRRTCSNNLKTVKAFFNWSVSHRLIAESPAAEIENPKYKERIPEWPDEDMVFEILKKAKAKKADYHRLILLSAFAGLRRAEMIRLKWRDMDFAEKNIRVQDTKSKHPRVVPMHETIADEFANPDPKAEWIFPSPIDPAKHVCFDLSRDCCLWMRAEGYPYTLHSFRHSFASRVARVSGMTVETLQSLLGHTSIRMTQVYMHSTSAHRASLVAQLGCPPQDSDTDEAIPFPTERAAG